MQILCQWIVCAHIAVTLDVNDDLVHHVPDNLFAYRKGCEPERVSERVSGTVGKSVTWKRCQVPLFGFLLGRPRGRNVDSSPSREAVRFCQGSVPYG